MNQKFDFFDPFVVPNHGLVGIPVTDLKATECRIRQYIQNSERRLFRKTVFLAVVSVAAGLLLSKIFL